MSGRSGLEAMIEAMRYPTLYRCAMLAADSITPEMFLNIDLEFSPDYDGTFWVRNRGKDSNYVNVHMDRSGRVIGVFPEGLFA